MASRQGSVQCRRPDAQRHDAPLVLHEPPLRAPLRLLAPLAVAIELSRPSCHLELQSRGWGDERGSIERDVQFSGESGRERRRTEGGNAGYTQGCSEGEVRSPDACSSSGRRVFGRDGIGGPCASSFATGPGPALNAVPDPWLYLNRYVDGADKMSELSIDTALHSA